MKNTRIKSRVLKSRSAGYSLVELIVATAVIAILSTMAVIYSRTTDRQATLTRQAEEVAFNIRRAQSFSLGSRRGGGIAPPCGYGVYFTNNSSQYLLYEERSLVSGSCPAANPPTPRPTYDPGTDVIIETISLQPGFSIGLSGSSLSITFLSPEPRITIMPGDPSETTIRVQLTGTSFYREVRVTTAGLVEVL